MVDESNTQNRKPAIIISHIDEQELTFQLKGVTLKSDKSISLKFVGWKAQKIDLNTEGNELLYFLILEHYGAPLNLEAFILDIDGDGTGSPDYYFRFIGFRFQDATQYHAVRSAEPFWVEIHQGDKKRFALMGYIWQKLVILKSQTIFKSYCAETHNATIISFPPHDRQQVVDIHVRSHIHPDKRDKEIRLLMDGYKHMRQLWDDVADTQVRRGKFTLREIEEMIDEAADKYAREQTVNNQTPETFVATHFAQHWRYRIKPTNLYKLIIGDEWRIVEYRYEQCCKRLQRDRK